MDLSVTWANFWADFLNFLTRYSAYAILAVWLIFILVYVVVRTLFPNEGRGRRKWKKTQKYDEDGFDANGWSALGFHRNGTRYDDRGLDRYGNPKPAGERSDLRAFDPVPEKEKPEEEQESK
ncbi:MAG: hypothetical protein J6X61_00590 [Clostridia bacterium]|nr:hypothetical protein [Clostridia bacterium]